MWAIQETKITDHVSKVLPHENQPLTPESVRFITVTLYMVHVRSYLNFSAKIRSLPSQNSMNVRKIFRRASAPTLQTGRRNVLSLEYGCLA